MVYKNAEYRRRYYAEHRKERLEYAKRCHVENPEKRRLRDRLNRARNADKVREAKRQYRVEHREQLREAKYRHRAENPEKTKMRDHCYRERRKEYIRKYRAENPEKEREYRHRPEAALRKRLRCRVREILNGGGKTGPTMWLLGITAPKFREHIESLWQPGMSWENFSEWHIDHYVPCNHFDLADPWQQRVCFNWRNLRPLWSADNLRKGTQLPYDWKTKIAEIEIALT